MREEDKPIKARALLDWNGSTAKRPQGEPEALLTREIITSDQRCFSTFTSDNLPQILQTSENV